MRTYKDVEVSGEAWVEIELEDVLEFIDQAKNHELKRIVDTLSITNRPFQVKTLFDQYKCELLTKAFDKYSLQELETKLGNL